jgi:hypothetical protein
MQFDHPSSSPPQYHLALGYPKAPEMTKPLPIARVDIDHRRITHGHSSCL